MTAAALTPGSRTRGRIAAATLAVLVAIAIAGPWLAPFDPAVSGDLVTDKLQPPSATHLMGTDASARDVFSRLLHGTRVSFWVAGLTVGVVLIIGVAWGAAAALAPPWADRWMMRFVDAVLATPRLLIVLACVAFTGRLDSTSLALLLGITGWGPMSRVVRGRVRELAATDYVIAARALGTPTATIVTRHLIPGVLPSAVALGILTVATVIPLEAALSFVGAGIAPPTASWGVILQDASARPLDAWWLLLFPSAAIAATVISVNVLGERLQRPEVAHLPR